MKTLFIVSFLVFLFFGCNNNPIAPPNILHKGIITYQNIEGGFWSIMPEKLVPFNLPKNFEREGVEVVYKYKSMGFQLPRRENLLVETVKITFIKI